MSMLKKAKPIDTRTLRNALGTFATGVAIATTCDDAGNAIGMTINSFNSVSLEPPLILWSIDKKAYSFQIFRDCHYFAIHILSAQQEALSNRFAKQGVDKFEGLSCQTGLGGIPLLPDCVSQFQCQVAHTYEGGDHLIIVGEVIDFTTAAKQPLVFHSGNYARLSTPLA